MHLVKENNWTAFVVKKITLARKRVLSTGLINFSFFHNAYHYDIFLSTMFIMQAPR